MAGKNKKGFIIIALIVIIIGGIYIVKKINDNNTDACYKPMVKVNDTIYYWSKDLEDVDLMEFTLIGEVEKSYNSGTKSIDIESENFSSNVFPVGSKLYVYDETSIIVKTSNVTSLCVEE